MADKLRMTLEFGTGLVEIPRGSRTPNNPGRPGLGEGGSVTLKPPVALHTTCAACQVAPGVLLKRNGQTAVIPDQVFSATLYQPISRSHVFIQDDKKKKKKRN